MSSIIIPAAIKEKLTPSSTDTLVYVLYLQEKGVEEKDTGVKKDVDDTKNNGNKKTMEETETLDKKGVKEEGTVDKEGRKEEKETAEIKKEELEELKGIFK